MDNKPSSKTINESKCQFDYEKLGFKCGIEIHQQLDTKKLFCDCDSIVNDVNPRVVAKRRLKAVVGETGEIDIAAMHEQVKGKLMIYEGCPNSYCLVELDEEPPHQINMDAVKIALQVAKMCHCEIVDEIQVMRKTVIDGSNVSGFQRTALVGMDGYIETSRGRVPIPSIMLEEESGKKIKADDESVIYRLDRLGVPLIEISTDASIKDAEHAKECAGIIGMILRSTGKVKRGIGTIRQDVNLSIASHPRIEVKGFQELKQMPDVIAYEIKRMQEEIKTGKEIKSHVRKFNEDGTTEFLRPMPGGARMYPETDVMPIMISKKLYDSIEIPKLISEKKDELVKSYNLDEGLVTEIIRKGYDFEAYVKEFSKTEPSVIASILIQVPKEIKRKENLDISVLTEGDFKEILKWINEAKVTKDIASELLLKKLKKEEINLDNYKGIDDSLLESEVKKIISEKPGLNMGGYMGLVMARFKGKIDGKKASSIISKCIAVK